MDVLSASDKAEYAAKVPHTLATQSVFSWQVNTESAMGQQETLELKDRLAGLLVSFVKSRDPVRLATYLTHRDITTELAHTVEEVVEQSFERHQSNQALADSRIKNSSYQPWRMK